MSRNPRSERRWGNKPIASTPYQQRGKEAWLIASAREAIAKDQKVHFQCATQEAAERLKRDYPDIAHIFHSDDKL